MNELGQLRPPDGGPIYTETILGRFPVEPWNTASNAIFLITIIYFAVLTRCNFRKHPLIAVGLPILAVGFVGGTLFHATRSDRVWLMMDYLPIFILCLLASFHFWRKVTGRFSVSVLLFAIPYLFYQLLRQNVVGSLGLRIGVGYSFLALSILLPAVLYCRSNQWRGARTLAMAILFFAIAITFRTLDRDQLLPMGTHFLWHIFGGLSVFALLRFIADNDVRAAAADSTLSRSAESLTERPALPNSP